MYHNFILFAIILVILESHLIKSQSQIIELSTSGTDVPGCGTGPNPACATLEYAFQSISSNDTTFHFASGIYSSSTQGAKLQLTPTANITIYGEGLGTSVLTGFDASISLTYGNQVHIHDLGFLSLTTIPNLSVSGIFVNSSKSLNVSSCSFSSLSTNLSSTLFNNDTVYSSAIAVVDTPTVFINEIEMKDLTLLSPYLFPESLTLWGAGISVSTATDIIIHTVSCSSMQSGTGRAACLLIHNFDALDLDSIMISSSVGTPITIFSPFSYSVLNINNIEGVSTLSPATSGLIEIYTGWAATTAAQYNSNNFSKVISNAKTTITGLSLLGADISWDPNFPNSWYDGFVDAIPLLSGGLTAFYGYEEYSDSTFTLNSISFHGTTCNHILCAGPLLFTTCTDYSTDPYLWQRSNFTANDLQINQNYVYSITNGPWFRSGAASFLFSFQGQYGDVGTMFNTNASTFTIASNSSFQNNFGVEHGALMFAAFGNFTYSQVYLLQDSICMNNTGNSAGCAEIFFDQYIDQNIIEIGSQTTIVSKNLAPTISGSNTYKIYSFGVYLGFSTFSSVHNSNFLLQGSFTHNQGYKALGGALFVSFWQDISDSSLTIQSLTCIENGPFPNLQEHLVDVGGVHVHADGLSVNNNWFLHNSTFLRNHGKQQGAVSLEVLFGTRGDSFSVSDCTFDSNVADSIAGALSIDISPEPIYYNMPPQKVEIQILQTKFINNSAVDFGGGLFVQSNTVLKSLILESVTFTNNSVSSGIGGGFYMKQTSDRWIGTQLDPPFIQNPEGVIVLVDEVTFDGNLAAYAGGAIGFQYPTFYVTDVASILSNVSRINIFGITNSMFTRNDAGGDGTDIWGSGGVQFDFIESNSSSCGDTTNLYITIQLDAGIRGTWNLSQCPSVVSEEVGELVQISTSLVATSEYEPTFLCEPGAVPTVSGPFPFFATCIPCPRSTYSLNYGHMEGKYILNSQSFDFEDTTVSSCQACPQGAFCPGGSRIESLPGFWGMKSDSCTNNVAFDIGDNDGKVANVENFCFIQCPDGYCCPRDSEDPCTYDFCNGNRTGPLCGDCKPGYVESLSSSRCQPSSDCDSPWKQVEGLVLSQAIAFIYVFLLLKSDKGVVTPLFKIVFNYLQLLPFVSPAWNFHYEHTQESPLYNFISSISRFVNLQFLSASNLNVCMYPMTAVSKLTMLYWGPIMSIFAIGVFTFFQYVTTRWIRGERKSNFGAYFPPQFSFCLGTVLSLTYTSFTFTSLELVHCVLLPDNSSLILYRAGSVTCYQWWQILLIVLLVLFIAPLPLFLLKLKSWLSRSQSKHSKALLLVLVGAYSPEVDWYESIQIVRRFLIIALSVTVRYASIASFWTTIACILIFFVSTVSKPYRHVPKMQNLEDFLLFDLCALSVISSIFGAWTDLGTSTLVVSSNISSVYETLILLFVAIPILLILGIFIYPYLKKAYYKYWLKLPLPTDFSYSDGDTMNNSDDGIGVGLGRSFDPRVSAHMKQDTLYGSGSSLKILKNGGKFRSGSGSGSVLGSFSKDHSMDSKRVRLLDDVGGDSDILDQGEDEIFPSQIADSFNIVGIVPNDNRTIRVNNNQRPGLRISSSSSSIRNSSFVSVDSNIFDSTNDNINDDDAGF